MKRSKGLSLVEMTTVLFIIMTAAAMSVPPCLRFLGEYRLRGATFYLQGLAREVRSIAASRNAYAGIVFDEASGEPVLSVYLDGNGNGIRRADVRSGADTRLRGPWSLAAEFPGVRYGAPPEGADEPPVAGIRLGRSDILSFSPLGSATSGTLLLSNEVGKVYGVVVLGATGRVRIGRYRETRWEPIL